LPSPASASPRAKRCTCLASCAYERCSIFFFRTVTTAGRDPYSESPSIKSPRVRNPLLTGGWRSTTPLRSSACSVSAWPVFARRLFAARVLEAVLLDLICNKLFKPLDVCQLLALEVAPQVLQRRLALGVGDILVIAPDSIQALAQIVD